MKFVLKQAQFELARLASNNSSQSHNLKEVVE
jgi:hypothetical protein